jgi:hypothetical protein
MSGYALPAPARITEVFETKRVTFGPPVALPLPMSQISRPANAALGLFALTCCIAVTPVSSASADVNWGVHIGGGIDGGTISHEVRPDGIVEAGTIVECLLPKRNWGFAAIVEQVARQTDSYDQREEIKADLLVRFATPNHKFRLGVGAGMRWITQDLDQLRPSTLRGVDIFRIDSSRSVVDWQPTGVAPNLALEIYGSWTIGCYNRDAQTDANEMKTRAIGCGDSITSAYIFGIRTTASWR